MNLYDTLTSFVPFQRLDAAMAAIQDADDIVSRDYCNALVKREVDWQHHWVDKFAAADARVSVLERTVNWSSASRLRLALADLATVPQQRSAKHDADCWQRHAGCLARRITEHLTGEGLS
jgi:hypothetical protein